MSVVIAVKDGDRFVLGADKQISCGGGKSHSGTKVWQVRGYENCCMGAVGSARGIQIINSVEGLLDGLGFGTKELPDNFISLALTRCIYETLKANGIECAVDDDECRQLFLPCEFFLAYKDRCWCIHHDMSVEEVEDYMAIGSGGDGAEHSMDTAVLFYKEKNPFKLITQAIDIVAERTIYVDHNIDFEVTVPREADAMKKLEALDPDYAKAIKEAIKQKKEADKLEKAKQDEKEAKKAARAAKKAAEKAKDTQSETK